MKSKSIAVVPVGEYSLDKFSAAVGLYNLLLDQEKEAHFVYTNEVPEEVRDLVSKEEVTSEIRNRELLVSIDYSGTEAANAHYSTEGDVLQVRISPIPNNFPKVGKVSAKLVGFEVDTVVLIGHQDASFDINQDFMKDADVVRISHISNPEFEMSNETILVDNTSTTVSQQIFKIAANWGFIPNLKASKALLKGLSS